MTKQEYINKESERIIEEDWKDTASPEDFVMMGLSKGLEIAEKFGVWMRQYDSDEYRGFYHKFNDGSHGKSHITPKFYTIEQLLSIYLTEINEKK